MKNKKTRRETLYVKFGGFKQMGKRFIDAWHQAEKGQKIIEKNLITFDDFTSLSKVLSNTRLQLLLTLNKIGFASVRQISHQLNRDYHGVHRDVKLLEAHKFIAKKEDKFYIPWEKISIPNVDVVLNGVEQGRKKAS